MNLKEELAKLIELQKFDSQIFELRIEKDIEKPKFLESYSVQLNQAKKMLLTCEEKSKSINLKKKEIELDLATKEEAVAKAQTQLYQLKTNKEYHAKLNEIASLKADISLFEEKVLLILDEIEQVNEELKKVKEEFSIKEQEIESQKKQINEELKEIELKISMLNEKRVNLTRNIAPVILTRYDKLISGRAGQAVAAVKNENCSACNIRVTAQTINELKSYANLVLCENCVRILYIDEDFNV